MTKQKGKKQKSINAIKEQIKALEFLNALKNMNSSNKVQIKPTTTEDQKTLNIDECIWFYTLRFEDKD